MDKRSLDLGAPQPGTEVSRTLRARNPKKVRKKSPKGCAGASGPGERQCPQRVRLESEKSPKMQLRTLFGRFSDFGTHSLGTLALPGTGGPEHPFGLFSDSCGVPGPKGGWGLPKSRLLNLRRLRSSTRFHSNSRPI